MIAKKVVELKGRDPSLQYSPTIGMFFTYGKSAGQVHSCRETFSYTFTRRTKAVGFKGSKVNATRIDRFFMEIEDKLGLEERSIVYRTQYDDAVIVQFSPFWNQNLMRRGFFTLFLRCAGAYHKTDIKISLLNYPLTARIPNAISRFLDGYTMPTFHPRQIAYGVVSYFSSNNANTALAKPNLS